MGHRAGTFKKGQNTNRKGIPNRTTKEAKEILQQALYKHMDKIDEALGLLYEKDPSRYLDACSKLFTYVLPKQSETEHRGKMTFDVKWEEPDGDATTEETTQ